MTAALAFARASGLAPEETLKLAVAAGAMNVTRHGLGSGDAEAIEQVRKLAQDMAAKEPEAAARVLRGWLAESKERSL
jgi:1-phosphofructokinase